MKTKEQLQAEQIIATMIRNNGGDPEAVLSKARKWASDFKFSIAQRVTVTVLLATLWDYYEDFNEDSVKKVYEEYMKYYESFSAGNENIFSQMLEINNMLDGELLTDKIFEITMEKANENM